MLNIIVLGQHGPNTSDLRAILLKHGTSWATSIKWYMKQKIHKIKIEKGKQVVICSNAQCAEWCIMHHWIEYTGCGLIYVNVNVINFCILVCLQRNFPQMFFIPRHINPENFIQTDQKLFELRSLVANHLARPRLQDFKKWGANSCFVTHNNIFCTHLVAMKIYNNVFHTYCTCITLENSR